jgi:acetyltransferase-like isoleucine patch superfamily enzyme
MPQHQPLPRQHHSDMFPGRSLPPLRPPPSSDLRGPTSEKEKMLNGEEYNPMDPELVADRKECQKRLAGVNNHSLSASERLLTHVHNVLTWAATRPSSQLGRPHVQGKIGPTSTVDSPFNCTYGYNIHLGNDVVISANCTIVDAGKVEIENDVVIGINVTILANDVPENPDKRRGTKMVNQSRPVVIEQNAYIGSNVTIYPGVRVRRGAYIMPGSVVTKVSCPYTANSLTMVLFNRANA